MRTPGKRGPSGLNVGLSRLDERSEAKAVVDIETRDGQARELVRTGPRRLVAAASLVVSDAASGLLVAASVAALVPSWLPAAGGISVLALAVLSQIVLKSMLGLYPGYGLHPEAVLSRGARAWGGAALIAAVGAWLLSGLGAAGIALLLATFLLALMTQVAGLHLVRIALDRAGLWGIPVRVIGEPKRAAALERLLLDARCCGLVPTRRSEDAAILLWAGDGLPDPATLGQLRGRHADIRLVSDLPTLSLSGLQPKDHGGTIGIRISGTDSGLLGPVPVMKRAFDLAIAVPAAVAVAPIVALAALAIRVIDPGPSFYVQLREGQGGRKIPMLKLRTMYRDADRMLEELLARDPGARAEWETHFKLRRDPRILPFVGRLLRMSSFDELPQLINIIRGDMSLVGPRPFPDYHLSAMCPDFRKRRASVVPGLTGLWQISDRSDADVAVQERIDGYYLDNRSFWFDLAIILRTFSAVIRGRGAY